MATFSRRASHPLTPYPSKSLPPMQQMDVVLFQEVWVDSDAALLSQAASEAGLVYSTHFKSGTFGSGLLTLSRHPIVASGFHRYSGKGYILLD